MNPHSLHTFVIFLILVIVLIISFSPNNSLPFPFLLLSLPSSVVKPPTTTVDGDDDDDDDDDDDYEDGPAAGGQKKTSGKSQTWDRDTTPTYHRTEMIRKAIDTLKHWPAPHLPPIPPTHQPAPGSTKRRGDSPWSFYIYTHPSYTQIACNNVDTTCNLYLSPPPY